MSRITWSTGGAGELVRLEGERVTLRCQNAAAPGSGLVGNGPEGLVLRVKVQRCVRDGEGFVVEGRLVDATRELRRALAHALGEPPRDGA